MRMQSSQHIPRLKIVDGSELPSRLRERLRPGEIVSDRQGREFALPRYFYEIDSWQTAREVTMAPNFGLYEFIGVDMREAPELRGFPRYVPLALTHLAAHLSLLRERVGTYVHIAANGGYRSPAHELSGGISVHCWGTAANLYRIGDDYLDTEETIDRYKDVVREVLPAARVRPFGRFPEGTIDQLHVDLGRMVSPPEAPFEVE